ncbi:MAG: hypothetical protein FWD87_09230 [Spirochaetaceae bacterium]|nr:hypothetical protein [Spirochaetaceae bacterium]
MAKKNLLVIVLICILAAASVADENPNRDRDVAIALYEEVRALRAEWLRGGRRDETREPFGRAKSIYLLSELYVQRGMYREALPGLIQARIYYLRFLGR